jgi:hypothetical protein
MGPKFRSAKPGLEREDIGRIRVSSTVSGLCVLRVIISGCISRGLKLEEVTRIGCNPRISCTCAGILEKLLTVIKSCVLSLTVINFHRETEPANTLHFGFLRAIIIRSTTSFGGDVKPSVPCRNFLGHLKEPCGV